MNVLVIGNGAREHAICWKLKYSKNLDNLYNLPYNDAINQIALSYDIDINNFEEIYKFCLEKDIEFVIVGPELPLSKGISDFLESKNIKVFGPKLQGAILESSKQVAKEFMKRNYIPTANFDILYDSNSAIEYVKNIEFPIVIKADGLAGGKGVSICKNLEEAILTIDNFMVKKVFGKASAKIIIEEYLAGYECSAMALIDGKNIVMLPMSKDYKRLNDSDEGPNTGGMGSICPFEIKEDLMEEIKNEVFYRFITGVYREKIDYRGILYAGLMITKNGPKVLEFNARLGDPETQSILPLIDEDLLDILYKTATGNLNIDSLKVLNKKCMSVVISSEGYPENPKKGIEISGLDKLESGILAFHSAIKNENGIYKTNGGRVLTLTALGENFKICRDKIYENIKKINFQGIHFRTDIGVLNE
jgi:phosphoribosylamine--glycine ligase